MTDVSDDERGRPAAGQSTFHTRHDWEDSLEISTTIIDAVAAVVGRAPTDIRPLYDSVDPDALDQLLLSLRSSQNADNRATVAFGFNGCEVAVEADGTVWIELTE